MTAPVRLRLSRARGFDLQALSHATNGLPAVNVARPSRWGNPWSCRGPYGCPHSPTYDWGCDADSKPQMHCCADVFSEWVRQGIAGEKSHLIGKGGGFLAGLMAINGNVERTKMVDGLPRLMGHNLACWCKPDAVRCHADVLLRLANPLTCEPATP